MKSQSPDSPEGPPQLQNPMIPSQKDENASYFQNPPGRDTKDHLGDSLFTLQCFRHFLWVMIHGE